MKKLSLNWSGNVSQSIEKARTLAAEYSRRDVPDNAPADLRDSASQGLETSKGFALSGRLLQSELVYGSDVPLAQFGTVLIPLVLAFTTLLLYWLPAWLAFIPSVLWALFAIMTGGFTLGWFAGVLALLLLWGSDISLFSMGGTAQMLQFGTGMTLTLISLAALPLCHLLRRAERFTIINDDAKAGAIILSASRQAKAREKQTERAARDTSPLIWLGEAQGVTWEKGDIMAPDPASRVALSAADLSTGLLVLGGTGTGKTSGVFRPVIRQWCEHNCGGLLLMDGKGQLPAELAESNRGITLLTPDNPETPVPLIDGLNAEEVAAVLVSVSGKGNDKGSDWTFAAEKQFRFSALLVELAASVQAAPWTLATIARCVSDTAFRDTLIEAVSARTETLSPELTTAALDFWLKEYPELAKAEGYTSSVQGIVTAWLSPLVGHRKMHGWINAAGGVNPSDVLRGARYGIGIDSSVYGELCTAAVNGFIKKRLYNEATRRGDNWKADSTNTAAMIVMDEADVLLDETDAGILPRGRSLGLNFVVGLQAVEQAEAAFGGTQNAPKALAMLAQLRSVVALSSTHHTAQYVSDRVGFGLPLEPVSLSTVPDMRYTVLQRAAASPFNDEENEFRSSITLDIPHVISHTVGKMMDHKNAAGERLQLAKEPKPWISPQECNMLTATEGVAVVVLNRAGAPRRDAIELVPEYRAG